MVYRVNHSSLWGKGCCYHYHWGKGGSEWPPGPRAQHGSSEVTLDGSSALQGRCTCPVLTAEGSCWKCSRRAWPYPVALTSPTPPAPGLNIAFQWHLSDGTSRYNPTLIWLKTGRGCVCVCVCEFLRKLCRSLPVWEGFQNHTWIFISGKKKISG